MCLPKSWRRRKSLELHHRVEPSDFFATAPPGFVSFSLPNQAKGEGVLSKMDLSPLAGDHDLEKPVAQQKAEKYTSELQLEILADIDPFQVEV